MIRENVESIRSEVYAAWWWCRCKSAASVATAAAALAEYCQWRGERAVVALWFTRRLVGTARRLLPAPLRPLIGE